MFLALLIGILGHHPSGLVPGIANMTLVADEAIKARRLGKGLLSRKMFSNRRRHSLVPRI